MIPEAEAHLRILMRKLLLGDDDAQRITEERGAPSADAEAARVAGEHGLCNCRRSDGIICGRPLWGVMGPSSCYPCWGRARDGKPCDHTGGK